MNEPCKRPGCTGTILDGVCDTCGRPPAGKSLLSGTAVAASKPVVAAATTASAVTGSRSSSSNSGRSSTRGSGTGSGRSTRVSTRRQLGAGMVSLPPMPSMDPMNSLMADPVVPERKRFCGNCNAKVTKEKGFCPMCGHEYNFRPALKAGDMVAGQFEVKGPIAFGGLGWIYLAWDKTLSRWVVLKGLLNSKDEASAAAAVAERQFLAAVKHPKIVGVYNFVTQGTEGYIVMEYVGGKTIKTIRQERGPLPVEEAIAYIHAILPAFAYLERMGMVYCDFKPDNFMLEDDDVKLIDMGGVRRIDDMTGDIYGTKGYSAPEANENPSFVSDLYTVARTLAVLLMEFKFQGTYEFSLPTPEEQPVLAQYDSLYRFLLKATRDNPDDRFQTAEEMADQLLGVLREIVVEHTTPRPAESTQFGGDAMVALGPDQDGVREANYRLLPALKVDPLDPAANLLLSAGVLPPDARKSLFERAIPQFPTSAEAPLRYADFLIEAGKYAEAEALLAKVEAADPFDWRVLWYRGRSLLAQGKAREALHQFDLVYGDLPGELAPKLAMAIAAELSADWKTAIRLYDLVSRTDPAYTTAAFGLARCRARGDDRTGAVEAYRRVPQTSIHYTQAQMSLARTLLLTRPAAPKEQELVQASEAIQALTLDGFALHRLSADILLAAIHQLSEATITANPSCRILGQPLEIVPLRFGAERELRACARHATTREDKINLVDQANQIRPRTLI